MMTNNPNDQGNIDDLKKSFESLSQPIDKVLDAIGSMYEEADKLNNAFLQGRTRLDEMNDAVSRAAAGVIRMGGDISGVGDTIIGISEGARRNVIATEEQVSKLYAASQILGTTSSQLVENFGEVGIETSKIGTNLEGSIKYVQSVGLNAKTVMKDVTEKMYMMNMFNFSDGVQGLTKMAAQASMLRFDMQNTANFADKVMSPDKAIEAAAGFQRLGVNIGNLVDPFALMNDSINNPGALQDSIIKATKKYTEFDEKTKSFKINPQGILMLKELSEVTGISARELSKTALAAADLDKRISAISPSLQFEKPEDKEFLANMATMKDGEYVVKLKDEKGGFEFKKLGDVTREEFEKLRKQQEEGPETLEEIQISQLDVLKNIQAALEGNIAKGTYGIAGSSLIRGNITGAERITRAVASSVDENVPESAKISKSVNDVVEKMGQLFTLKDVGKVSNKDFEVKLTKLQNEIKDKSISLGEKGFDTLKTILQDANKKVTGSSAIEQEFKRYTSEILGVVGTPKKSTTSKISGTSTEPPISKSSFFGRQNVAQISSTGSATKEINQNVKVEVDHKGMSSGNVEQKIKDYVDKKIKLIFESEEYKKMNYEYKLQMEKELGLKR